MSIWYLALCFTFLFLFLSVLSHKIVLSCLKEALVCPNLMFLMSSSVVNFFDINLKYLKCIFSFYFLVLILFTDPIFPPVLLSDITLGRFLFQSNCFWTHLEVLKAKLIVCRCAFLIEISMPSHFLSQDFNICSRNILKNVGDIEQHWTKHLLVLNVCYLPLL